MANTGPSGLAEKAIGELQERVGRLERRVIVPGGKGGEVLVRRHGRREGAAWESPVLDANLTEQELVNSTGQTSIYSFKIKGGTLGATGGFRVTLGGDFLNNTGGDRSLTLRIKLGATTVYASNAFLITTDADRRYWYLTILCVNSATNAQQWSAFFHLSPAGTTDFIIQSTASQTRSTGAGGRKSSALDTKADLTFDVTAQFALASASLSIRRSIAVLRTVGGTSGGGGGGVRDADAIHDNVAGEIAALTEKVTPVSADLLLIEDSAAANAKKRVQVGNLPGGGGGGPHAMESTDHTGGTRGDIAVRGASDYDLLAVGAAGDAKMSDGTDVVNLHPSIYTISVPGRMPNGSAQLYARWPVVRAGTITRYRIFSWQNTGPTTTNLVMTLTHFNSAGTQQWTETGLTLTAGSNDSGDTALSAARTLVAGGYFLLSTTTSNGTAIDCALLAYDQ